MRTSSFTSRSSAWTITTLTLAAILSAAFSWYAKCHWEVENQYWGQCVYTSKRYAEQLFESSPTKYVVFGGSTVRTSYIPSVFKDEFGIPLVNAGVHAGLGADVLAEVAFREIRTGDTVVVAVEPYFLACEKEVPPTSGGIDFCLWLDGLSFRRNTFFSLSPFHIVEYLRGNTRYNLVMIMKRLCNMKPYRYVASENLHEDGWMEVFERRSIPFDSTDRPVPPLHLGAAGKAFLLRVKKVCEHRGCRVLYAIPPLLEGNPNARNRYASLVRDILPIMPVAKDPLLGVNPNPDEFADTDHHPSRIGALRASRSLGTALANGDFWDEHSLRDVLSPVVAAIPLTQNGGAPPATPSLPEGAK